MILCYFTDTLYQSVLLPRLLWKWVVLVHSYDRAHISFPSKQYLSSGFCISKATVKQMLPLLHLIFFCLLLSQILQNIPLLISEKMLML